MSDGVPSPALCRDRERKEQEFLVAHSVLGVRALYRFLALLEWK